MGTRSTPVVVVAVVQQAYEMCQGVELDQSVAG